MYMSNRSCLRFVGCLVLFCDYQMGWVLLLLLMLFYCLWQILRYIGGV